MFPWKAVAVGGVALSAIGAVVYATRRSTEPASPKRVALIGDSYAVGLGPELEKILSVFRYEGHVGSTAQQWANHSAACGDCGDWLTTFKPNLVLVSLGTNDTALRGAQTIVRALHGIGARVVWLEPPRARAELLAAISALGVDRIAPSSMSMAPDGLHPTADGYHEWARTINGAIRA